MIIQAVRFTQAGAEATVAYMNEHRGADDILVLTRSQQHPNKQVAESNNPIQEIAPAGAKSRWQAGVRALRHRNFQLFFSGQLISLIGTWMQTVAQSWLVYRLTGSGLQLGADPATRSASDSNSWSIR